MKKITKKRSFLYILSILLSLIIGFIIGVLSVPENKNISNGNEEVWKEIALLNEEVISYAIESREIRLKADEAIENYDFKTSSEMTDKLNEITEKIKNINDRKSGLLKNLNE